MFRGSELFKVQSPQSFQSPFPFLLGGSGFGGGVEAARRQTKKYVKLVSERGKKKKWRGREKSGRISPLSSGRRGSLPLGGRPVWLGLRLVNHSATASVAG